MKITSPFLNKMSGKLGDSVGSKWNGIKYLREYVEPSNPRTQKQIEQRAKFTMVRHWLKPLGAYVKVGWKLYREHMTAMNAVLSYVLKNAVTGAYPAYSVNYADVLVACGGLKQLSDASLTIGTNGAVFSWTDNTGSGDAKSDDVVFPLIYNEDKAEIAEMLTATRAAGTLTVKLPTQWSGDTVRVWIAVRSDDGSAVSNSSYLGDYTAV